jgi:hypothetical protein
MPEKASRDLALEERIRRIVGNPMGPHADATRPPQSLAALLTHSLFSVGEDVPTLFRCCCLTVEMEVRM